MPGDLRDARLLYAKAAGFVLVGLLAGGLILLDSPSLRVALLLLIAVWAFARAYYFCFYVIERYVDPSYRFAGLTSVARYFLAHRGRRAAPRRPG